MTGIFLLIINNLQLPTEGMLLNQTYKILQYQSILQNPQCILIQQVELFSARMYG